jgi:hypothetical protein
MKRGSERNNYFVVAKAYDGTARIYQNIETWVKDYKKNCSNLDGLINDLSNEEGPEWAKSFVMEEDRKCNFDGKKELLKACKNLPYRPESIDVQHFLGLFDPDMSYYKAKLIKH